MISDPSPPRGVAAIQAAFEMARVEGRSALIGYLTLGYPTPADSLELVPALEAGGADIIELGIPFSDPVADGPAIQRASHVALGAGVTPSMCLELAGHIRTAGVSVPILFMGYFNPVHSYGLERYVAACVSAGVDGLIVPDLPPEEGTDLGRACDAAGLALVYLVAPNSPPARVASIASANRGFVYVVSRLGTTGESRDPALSLDAYLDAVREQTDLPVAVGFGISTPEHVRALAGRADGIIVGTGVVQRATEGPNAVRSYIASLRSATGWKAVT